MGIDVVILSRGRERVLTNTLKRLSKTDLNVVVMHNNPNRIPASQFGANTTYVFCPDVNFGTRAARAIQYIKSDFCIISTDDDGLIERELFRMEKFLEENKNFSSVGGIAIGAFPYGGYVSGTIAYREMHGYVNESTDRIERIKNQIVPMGNSYPPRTALYRLSRRELTCKLLEALGQSSKVSTPYVYELTAEIVSASAGNTAYIQSPYWIRNWKNEMISNSDWNRKYGFDTWWNDSTRKKEQEFYIDFLSSFLSLDVCFIKELLQNYASIWGKVFRVPNHKMQTIRWNFARSIFQNLNRKFRPSHAPTSVEDLIKREFPNLPKESKTEICTVAYDMFHSKY